MLAPSLPFNTISKLAKKAQAWLAHSEGSLPLAFRGNAPP